MRIYKTLHITLLSMMLVLASCSGWLPLQANTPQSGGGTAPAQSLDGSPIVANTKVAFIYPGSVSEVGWSQMHDQARIALHEQFPNLSTAYQENVDPSSPDAERIIYDYAQQGFDIIVTTSPHYIEATLKVARQFPNTAFVNIGGDKTASNVGTFLGIEEPRYVSGLIAGMMTKSNTLGYVASFPTSEVTRDINAFALGVRKSNPSAVVKVRWTKDEYDTLKERQAAEVLLDDGVDVITHHRNMSTVQKVAESRGKLSVGYDLVPDNAAPSSMLTSPIWNWGKIYTNTVKQVQGNTWKGGVYWSGWKDGVVDLTPISYIVPANNMQKVQAEIAKFKQGDETLYTIFSGPLKDQSGIQQVPAGVSMISNELLQMNWFVEGVEITNP